MMERRKAMAMAGAVSATTAAAAVALGANMGLFGPAAAASGSARQMNAVAQPAATGIGTDEQPVQTIYVDVPLSQLTGLSRGDAVDDQRFSQSPPASRAVAAPRAVPPPKPATTFEPTTTLAPTTTTPTITSSSGSAPVATGEHEDDSHELGSGEADD